MKRNAGLLLLLVASVAAGFLLWKPAPPAPQPAACDAGDSCAVPAATEEPEASTPADPGQSLPPPAPAPSAAKADGPVVVVDPVRLRAEADRLIAEGRILEGVEALRQATYANPTAKNHGDLGSLLEKLTVFDEALRELKAAAELEPGNPDRWVDVANAAYRAVDPGEAWAAERRAREAQPGLKLQRGPGGLWLRPSDSTARNP